MAILSGLVILIYLCYTAFSIRMFGIPHSYSATYYLLGGKEKDGWIFQVVMAFLAFGGLISGLDTGGYWNFLAFIPAAALAFVAVAPDFKYDKTKTLENKVHMRASYIAVIGATFSFWLKFNVLVASVAFIVLVLIITLLNIKNKIFWIEHVCFDIYLVLLLISHL